MKTRFFFLVTAIAIIFISFVAQAEDQWTQYTDGGAVSAFAIDGDYIWIGTAVGAVKMNRHTYEKEYFNNSTVGMDMGRIDAITVDEQGNKWFGTYSHGIFRFDNNKWTNFTQENSGLPSNKITNIKVDGKGNMWFATFNNGIVKYDGEFWTVFNKENSCFNTDRIVSLECDADGNIWGLDIQLTLAKFDGQKWTEISTSEVNVGDLYLIIKGLENKLWFVGYAGIVTYENESWVPIEFSFDNSPECDQSTLTFDSNDNAWVALYHKGGVAKYDGTDWIVFSDSASKMADKMILKIEIDDEGGKWFGSVDGAIVKYDDENRIILSNDNSDIPSNYISSITFNGQNTWIGTIMGAVKYDGDTWTTYNKDNCGLTDNNISTIAFDSQGYLWVGTRKGIVIYNGKIWNFCELGEDLSQINIIVKDEDGNIWIGSNGNTAMYDGEFFTEYPIYRAKSIAFDNNGVVWIGTDGNGVSKIDGDSITYYSKEISGLPHNTVHASAIDKDGNKWFGTWNNGKGLVKYDDENWTIYNTANSDIPSNSIESLAFDDEGILWVGTLSGLAKFDGQDWKIYNSSNSGLSGNRITAINFDSAGNKWIGTYSNGVSVLNENPVSVQEIQTTKSAQPTHPNPFRTSTTINYMLENSADVTINIYNSFGGKVKELKEGYKTTGQHSVIFQASGLPQGMYYYTIQTGKNIESGKMILAK